MKYLIVMMSLITSATAFGFEELREFKLDDGTAFKASVISCDSHYDVVELMAEDGISVTSGIAGFSDTDQDYLKQWEMCDLFMSPTQFVVIPRLTVDRQLRGQPGEGKEENDFTMVCAGCAYEYNLTLYNLGSAALENLTVNYHILYKQKCSASDTLSFSQQLPAHVAAEGEVSLSYGVDGTIPVSRWNPTDGSCIPPSPWF